MSHSRMFNQLRISHPLSLLLTLPCQHNISHHHGYVKLFLGGEFLREFNQLKLLPRRTFPFFFEFIKEVPLCLEVMPPSTEKPVLLIVPCAKLVQPGKDDYARLYVFVRTKVFKNHQNPPKDEMKLADGKFMKGRDICEEWIYGKSQPSPLLFLINDSTVLFQNKTDLESSARTLGLGEKISNISEGIQQSVPRNLKSLFEITDLISWINSVSPSLAFSLLLKGPLRWGWIWIRVSEEELEELDRELKELEEDEEWTGTTRVGEKDNVWLWWLIVKAIGI